MTNPHLTLRHIIAELTGHDITQSCSPRTAHIVRTYAKLLNNLRPDDTVKRKHYISRCLADLAGANGHPELTQRTEIRL